MPAKTLMVMGTSSSVGKSVLTAALCRIFARRGLRVAPFKAQNMSNNAAVCANGAEIGRAQAVQARAAGVAACADMNPVLLKPEGGNRSQVIVLGKPWETLNATRYYERKSALWSIVTAALDRLREAFDLIVIEGAGSPVELNLKENDIVNMAIARHARSPVLLVGDIDKGGIFAQLLGTLWLLPAEERALVRGLIVNKFRGDPALFTAGLRILEERGETPVLGVVPFLADLDLPEEDAAALSEGQGVRGEGREETASSSSPAPRASPLVDIVIVRLPHIANFDDFDPLARERGVQVRYVQNAAALGHPHAVILPGTKSTMADLEWLCKRDLGHEIQRLAADGVAIVGICGGFQMMGRTIRDPAQAESMAPMMPGLGLLPVETIFERTKITQEATARVLDAPGWLHAVRGQTLQGYEIHMGRTVGSQGWLEIQPSSDKEPPRRDGAVSPDGCVWGCYLHGLFANPAFRQAWLGSLPFSRDPKGSADEPRAPLRVAAKRNGDELDNALDRLADAVEIALDMERLQGILSSS